MNQVVDAKSATFEPWGLKEECGVFGVWGCPDEALPYVILGLHALQHRGQEGVGIVTNDKGDFSAQLDAGLVSDVFSADRVEPGSLPGTSGIGHNRYATSGSGDLANLQPILQRTKRGPLALAHNGNLTNADVIREALLEEGSLFHSDSDTEVAMHLISRSKRAETVEAIDDALGQIEGAYSFLLLSPDAMIGVRDPYGMRPLTIGRLGDMHILSSESCAIQAVGGEVIRDVEPGEMVIVTDTGIESRRLDHADKQPEKLCVFEYIYFMRPHTIFGDRHAATVRERIGAKLFEESHAETDIVIPVPESGVHSAVGYAEAAGLPFRWAIQKSPYVGRTFIEPTQSIRQFGVRLKLSVDQERIQGRRVTLVDDSIVRSTTMKKLIELVRAAGATEVHIRISSPPFAFPCFYGIDTPDSKELIAASHSVDEIRQRIGADTLAYISPEGLRDAVNGTVGEVGFCDACFTGNYPVPLVDRRMQDKLAGTGASFATDAGGPLL